MKSIHTTGIAPHRMPALKRYDLGLMDAYEVTTRVDAPNSKDASLLDPHQQ